MVELLAAYFLVGTAAVLPIFFPTKELIFGLQIILMMLLLVMIWPLTIIVYAWQFRGMR